MRTTWTSIILFLSATVCVADTISDAEVGRLRIGAWNIANLHAEEGKKPEGREGFSKSRDTQHYEWLKNTASDINFDAVTLQEIHSREAVHRVFPKEGYTVCFEDSRKAADQNRPINERDAIYTAVAVKTSAFTKIECFELGNLSIDHTDSEGVTRKVRGGTGALLSIGGKQVTLLSVHLKSSCSKLVIDPPAKPDCITLGKQIPILNAWIDAAYTKNPEVIVAGDFNRAMEFEGDQFWPQIDDAVPTGLDLFRIPFGNDSNEASVCKDRPLQIDHIIFPKELYDGSGGTLDYETGTFRRLPIPGATKDERERLSDHCPEWGDFTVLK